MNQVRLKFIIGLFFGVCSFQMQAQNGFVFKNNDSKKQRLKFELINNLIIIPLEINGKELSFILDSGVNKTILFDLSEKDSIGLNNVKIAKLRGLGSDAEIDALVSTNNILQIGNLVNTNEDIYVILKDYFDLSGKMGKTIHGILGYGLLKNFITKINYQTKKIDFYNPKKYSLRKCKSCEVLPFKLHLNKPFVNAEVVLNADESSKVKLLIDTGGSDALWLFENTNNIINTPQNYFVDILGEGLSGTIYGKRSRLQAFKIANYELKQPTASFLDSVATKNARSYKERNGSIGGEVLKRFTVWLDYPNQQLMLKKNGNFKSPFNYNMSGLDVVYNGKILVQEVQSKNVKDFYNQSVSESNTVSFITSFSYKFKPSYLIKDVVKNSPAHFAGVQKGDVIISINKIPAHEFTLGDILRKFQEKADKKIKLKVNRNGKILNFEFLLEQRI